MEHPRFEKSYPANVLIVILALFPGLINTSAIAIVAPAIGQDFGISPAQAGSLLLFNDAALAFGCLLAAELARRVDSRRLFFWLMGVSLCTSVASATAPSFAVLLVAHVVHGLVGGMLFVVMLPPLLGTFGSRKLRATATVLVPALFGAATLGPVVGAIVASPFVWRGIFVAETFLAIAALVVGYHTLPKREPPPTDDPVDVPALVLAALGSAAIFVGTGGLAAHDWDYLPALVPLLVGIMAFATMLVVEALRARPLVPVRKLFTSIALVGALATVIGSACFSATQQSIVLSLQRLDGLTPREAGMHLWPEFIAATIAGLVFGRLVTTKWLFFAGAAGLALSGLGAGIAYAATPITPSITPWLVVVTGLGAGLAVTPGLLLVALSFERASVGRAIALLNLLRLTAGFITVPGIEHTIGSHAGMRLAAIDPHVHDPAAAMRAFILDGIHSGIAHDAFQAALASGIQYVLGIACVLAAAGIIAIALVFALGRIPIRDPDLTALDEGKPAISAR